MWVKSSFSALWWGGNMFYSLGELQLWVFEQNRPTSGGDTAKTPFFHRILPAEGFFWLYIRGCGRGVGTSLEVFGPPRVPQTGFQPPETDFGWIWENRFFEHFWPIFWHETPQPNPFKNSNFRRKTTFFDRNWRFWAIFRPEIDRAWLDISIYG